MTPCTSPDREPQDLPVTPTSFSSPTTSSATTTRAPWTPWRTVMAFGVVSLAADMVYEGMRSMAGPFLGTLGASALPFVIITGAGDAIALDLRLVSGPGDERTGIHWSLTFWVFVLAAHFVPL